MRFSKLILLKTILPLAGIFLFANFTLAAESGFVSVSGTGLWLDGNNFQPKGMNHLDNSTLWSSTSTLPNGKWITKKDFADFKAAGFNSIRLAVKTDYFQDVKPPHKFSTQGFAWLDRIIGYARANDIKIVLDMHIPTGGQAQDYRIYPENQVFWNDPWLKGRYVDVWREIARRYANEKTIWGYDMMNEPATWDFEAYQKLMQSTASSIRTYDKNHVLIVQPGMMMEDNQALFIYPQIPDSQIVRSIHFYQPLGFTHQNVPWGVNGQDVIASYPSSSTNWTADNVYNSLKQAWKSAEPDNFPVVLFEFGTVFQNKNTGQPIWVQDVIRAAKKLGMGWHYWNYKGPSYQSSLVLTVPGGKPRPITWGILSKEAKNK